MIVAEVFSYFTTLFFISGTNQSLARRNIKMSATTMCYSFSSFFMCVLNSHFEHICSIECDQTANLTFEFVFHVMAIFAAHTSKYAAVCAFLEVSIFFCKEYIPFFCYTSTCNRIIVDFTSPIEI